MAEGLHLDGVPDRRRDQFPKEFGYAAFPYPYRLPGIGSGIAVVAGALNVADTHTDVYGIGFTGDVRGCAVALGASTSRIARAASSSATTFSRPVIAT